jgi:hypothetical protein
MLKLQFRRQQGYPNPRMLSQFFARKSPAAISLNEEAIHKVAYHFFIGNPKIN